MAEVRVAAMVHIDSLSFTNFIGLLSHHHSSDCIGFGPQSPLQRSHQQGLPTDPLLNNKDHSSVFAIRSIIAWNAIMGCWSVLNEGELTNVPSEGQSLTWLSQHLNHTENDAPDTRLGNMWDLLLNGSGIMVRSTSILTTFASWGRPHLTRWGLI